MNRLACHFLIALSCLSLRCLGYVCVCVRVRVWVGVDGEAVDFLQICLIPYS